MAASINIKKRTEFFIRDLHARERMRLGWYRQFGIGNENLRMLRERKARHTAFLLNLLRKRNVSPAWYAPLLYILGHGLGFISAFLPEFIILKIENTLESWIHTRYKKYLREMKLDAMLRSMVESVRLKKFAHQEPGEDVLRLIEDYIVEHEQDEYNNYDTPFRKKEVANNLYLHPHGEPVS